MGHYTERFSFLKKLTVICHNCHACCLFSREQTKLRHNKRIYASLHPSVCIAGKIQLRVRPHPLYRLEKNISHLLTDFHTHPFQIHCHAERIAYLCPRNQGAPQITQI